MDAHLGDWREILKELHNKFPDLFILPEYIDLKNKASTELFKDINLS
jgi:hypothetical protein